MVKLTEDAIDLETILRQLEDFSTGGVAVFIGRVRDHAHGRKVVRMQYEGYIAMAEKQLSKLESIVRKRWPVRKMAIVHRLGMLELGEASVVIAVACAHRNQAFQACKYTIDTLKKTVPIWKKEFGLDGSSWVEGEIPEAITTEEDYKP